MLIQQQHPWVSLTLYQLPLNCGIPLFINVDYNFNTYRPTNSCSVITNQFSANATWWRIIGDSNAGDLGGVHRTAYEAAQLVSRSGCLSDSPF